MHTRVCLLHCEYTDVRGQLLGVDYLVLRSLDSGLNSGCGGCTLITFTCWEWLWTSDPPSSGYTSREVCDHSWFMLVLGTEFQALCIKLGMVLIEPSSLVWNFWLQCVAEYPAPDLLFVSWAGEWSLRVDFTRAGQGLYHWTFISWTLSLVRLLWSDWFASTEVGFLFCFWNWDEALLIPHYVAKDALEFLFLCIHLLGAGFIGMHYYHTWFYEMQVTQPRGSAC